MNKLIVSKQNKTNFQLNYSSLLSRKQKETHSKNANHYKNKAKEINDESITNSG